MSSKSLIGLRAGGRLIRIKRTFKNFSSVINYCKYAYSLKIECIELKTQETPTTMSFILEKKLKELLGQHSPKLKELSEFLEISSVNNFDIDEDIEKQLVVMKRGGGVNQSTFKTALSACAFRN
jgi:hypothetical protein